MNPVSHGIASGIQRDPGRRTNGRIDIELCESDAFGGQAVYVWRGNNRISITTQIPIAHVINEKDCHIGPWGSWAFLTSANQEDGEKNKQEKAAMSQA